jgi:hypothetical protein
MGKTEDIKKVVYKKKKNRHLDAMEKYYMCNETKKGTQINDKNEAVKNRIFDTVVKFDTQQLAHQGSLRKHHHLKISAS